LKREARIPKISVRLLRLRRIEFSVHTGWERKVLSTSESVLVLDAVEFRIDLARIYFDVLFIRHAISNSVLIHIAAKAGPVPTYQRSGSNNHDNKDRRKPAIELNEEPAVAVRETSPALQLTPQYHQLTSERGIPRP
jgi:hypothetical protein